MPGPVCTACGTAVSAGDATRNPRLCPPCRANYDWPAAERTRAAAERARAVAERDRRAQRIDGQPWWLSPRSQVVVRYAQLEGLEAELDIAAEHGWQIAQTDSVDGHVNIGRIIAFGALSLLTPLRSKGSIAVTWERAGAATGGPADDPVATLKQLKAMLDLALISEDEYNAKKAEILGRL